METEHGFHAQEVTPQDRIVYLALRETLDNVQCDLEGADALVAYRKALWEDDGELTLW